MPPGSMRPGSRRTLWHLAAPHDTAQQRAKVNRLSWWRHATVVTSQRQQIPDQLFESVMIHHQF